MNSELVLKWAKELRLGDWVIDLIPDEDQKDAHVIIDRERRSADILYSPDLTQPEWFIAHEMVHVMLADMDFIACNGRSIDVMEHYNLLEERVCNTLADVLYAKP